MFSRTSSVRFLSLSLLASCSFGGLFAASCLSSALAADVSPFSKAADVGESVDALRELPVEIPIDSGFDAEEQIPAEMANYSDGKVSLDYPATWQVDVSEDGAVGIVNVPETPLARVETNLYQVEAPPGPLVNANIDSFIEEGAAVSRYRSVTIDEQSALVIWLAERPGDLSSAIATFIGYGDETVFLFSRYSPDNTAAEQTILSLHGSFVNLAADADPASDTADDETVFSGDEKPVLPTDELPLQNEDFPSLGQ